MKEIPLAKNRGFAIVDDEDFDFLSKYKWKINPRGYIYRNFYKGNGHSTSVLMHRKIMSAPKGMEIDHINNDKLDNRKSNLRLCTVDENSRNRKLTKRNTHGYKGVKYDKRRKNWSAQISHKYKKYHLGTFTTVIEAAKAYNEGAKKYHGEFASLNDV